MKKVQIRLAALTLSLLCCAGEATAEIVVVVGKDSPIASLSPHEINDIFLGNATSLPKIGKVVPVDRSE